VRSALYQVQLLPRRLDKPRVRLQPITAKRAIATVQGRWKMLRNSQSRRDNLCGTTRGDALMKPASTEKRSQPSPNVRLWTNLRFSSEKPRSRSSDLVTARYARARWRRKRTMAWLPAAAMCGGSSRFKLDSSQPATLRRSKQRPQKLSQTKSWPAAANERNTYSRIGDLGCGITSICSNRPSASLDNANVDGNLRKHKSDPDE
jgi:hypothetical protein